MRLLHFEDEPLKARTIRRVIKRLRPDLAYEHYENANAGRRILWNEVEGGNICGVVTDWTMPMLGGGQSKRDAGAIVARDCLRLGVPVVVVSGGPKPDWFDGEFGTAVAWIRFEAHTDVESSLRAFVEPL